MSELTQKKIIPVSILHGKKAFLSGIEWKDKPVNFRDARAFAQSQKADLYLSYQYSDSQSGEKNTMVAIVRRHETDIPQNIRQYLSLAMLVRPLLKSGGYAILELVNNGNEITYTFISVIDEILVNDITGSLEEITEARNTFLMLNTEPETGWIRYEPEIFSINGINNTLPLSTLTVSRKSPLDACLRPVSRSKQLMTILLVIAVFCALWYGWQRYQIWQSEKVAREEAARKAAADRITPPWLSQPEIGEYIQGCSNAWSSLPVSVVGWRFSLAECSINGTNGSLRASYTNIAGTTVTDFSHRITEIFSTRPFMVMPEGNSGGFSLPVSLKLPENPVTVEMLPATNILQERLTTFAQSMRLKIDWRQVNNSITDEDGKTIQPPWQEYDLEIQTDIPPFTLFQNFNESSIRLTSIFVKLEGSRLHYQFTGKYYAR